MELTLYHRIHHPTAACKRKREAITSPPLLICINSSPAGHCFLKSYTSFGMSNVCPLMATVSLSCQTMVAFSSR